MSTRFDIFRIYAAERFDSMDDLVRHTAPGLMPQPVPDAQAGDGRDHR